MPLVSVLVTVYNRELYLADSLSSIANSFYDDFEVIIVDDCSDDESFSIAEKFAKQNPRFRVFKNDRNLGQFRNRNRAAELANSKYIKYLDSDDVLYKHSLGVMLESIESNPTAGYAISSPIIDPATPYPLLLPPTEIYRNEFLGRGCLSAGPSGSIIKRESFVKVGGYRDVGVVGDIDLWYRLAAENDTILLQPALVWWRRHSMQAFSSNNAEEDYLTGEFRITLDALTSATCPLHDSDRLRAIKRKKQHFARKLLGFCLKRRNFSPLLMGMRNGLGVFDLVRGLRRYY